MVLDGLTTQYKVNDAIKDFTTEGKLSGKWTRKSSIYYEQQLRYFIPNSPEFLHEISLSTILNHLEQIEKGMRIDKFGKRIQAPYMKQAAYRAIKAFLNWCEAREFIVKSPIPKKFKIGKPVDVTHVPPTKEHLKLLLDSFDDSFLGKRNKALLLCYANTGCRLSELLGSKLNDRPLGIQDGDINWETREITVFGKGRKVRIIGVQPNTAKAMFSYLLAVKKRFPQKQSPAFWLTEEGHPLQGVGFSEVLRRLRIKFGTGFSAHDLRRFMITSALESGMNETAVMALSGHSSHSMMQRYSRTFESARARQQLEKNSPVAGL
jgi:integrase